MFKIEEMLIMLNKKTIKWLKTCKNLIFYGSINKKQYIIFEKEKLIYIPISKCWNTSMRICLSSLLWAQVGTDLAHDIIFPTRSKLGKKYLDGTYTIFVIVRDPLERLISCYLNQVEPRLKNPDIKVAKWGKYNILDYLFGYLRYHTGNIEKFLRRIVVLPTSLMDIHFQPMYDIIWVKDYSKVTFLDLKHLSTQFEPIRKKFNLPHLERQNTTDTDKTEIIKSLPKDLLKKIHKVYKKDFDLYRETLEV